MSSTVTRLPKGSLHIERSRDSRSDYWVGHWTCPVTRRPKKARLGRAHVLRIKRGVHDPVPDVVEAWMKHHKRRPGRPTDGALTPDDARLVLRGKIEKATAEASRVAAHGEVPTFRQAATEWLADMRANARRDAGIKWTTVDGWETALREADYVPAKRGRAPSARLMRPFGDRPLDKITPREIKAMMLGVVADGKAPRTANWYRSVLLALYQWATLPENYGALVEDNPAAKTSKLPEPDRDELILFTQDQVWAVAEVFRSGAWRKRATVEKAGGRFALPTAVERRAWEDRQNAAMVVAAAFTGLRQGELLALRWRDVDTDAQRVTVVQNYTGGRTTNPKGRRARKLTVPSVVTDEIKTMRERGYSIGANDLVFAATEARVVDGKTDWHIDGSRLNKRFKAASSVVREQDPDLPAINWKELRHTYGSLQAAALVPLTKVRDNMGHSHISTTMVYMGFIPTPDEAQQQDAIFKRPRTPAAVTT